MVTLTGRGTPSSGVHLPLSIQSLWLYLQLAAGAEPLVASPSSIEPRGPAGLTLSLLASLLCMATALLWLCQSAPNL